jgi:class 3 adenylate cyclase
MLHPSAEHADRDDPPPTLDPQAHGGYGLRMNLLRSDQAPDAEGTLAFLFTDLAGSTRLWEQFPQAMQDALKRHDVILGEAIQGSGGHVVKTMGDGFMASFNSVTRGMECATALQRAFARYSETGEGLAIRAGLNAGEPIEEDGDLFGSAVILAARIAAKASAGEIFVSDVIRGLLAGKGYLFADRGDMTLRGFEDPVHVYEVPVTVRYHSRGTTKMHLLRDGWRILRPLVYLRLGLAR